MARTESDREDLFLEATSLVRRIEIRLPREPDVVLIGFRSTDWLSIYFGQDLMYQFDEHGQFRRGYSHGLLFRTQGNSLAQLRRERSETETSLMRQDLPAEALATYRAEVLTRLVGLRASIVANEFCVLRQHPAEDHQLMTDIIASLDSVLAAEHFLAPAIKR